MATERKAEVTWQGDLMSGSGRIDSVTSGTFGGLAVSWPARTEEPGGKTSPEELIAAAHASCFAMSLSNILAKNDTPPDRLDVGATSSFEKRDAGFRLTRMHLDVAGSVPGVDAETFQSKAEEAKVACPVSNALANNVDISVTANLK